LRHQVRGLRDGDLPDGPGATRAQQGVPPQVLHLPGVPQATVHRRGAVRAGRAPFRLQGRLPRQATAAPATSCLPVEEDARSSVCRNGPHTLSFIRRTGRPLQPPRGSATLIPPLVRASCVLRSWRVPDCGGAPRCDGGPLDGPADTPRPGGPRSKGTRGGQQNGRPSFKAQSFMRRRRRSVRHRVARHGRRGRVLVVGSLDRVCRTSIWMGA
ncbi:unnamed protein product, partial [Ixodes persulcatus]